VCKNHREYKDAQSKRERWRAVQRKKLLQEGKQQHAPFSMRKEREERTEDNRYG